ncbi:MAG: alanine racemase [Kiritimatiellia bacterium]
MNKYAWTEIHLATLASNLTLIRKALAPGTDLIGMLKADAYGHGLEQVGRAAWNAGVRRFAVFHLEEAASLRALLADATILFIGVADCGDAADLLDLRTEPLLVTADQALALADAAEHLHARLACQVKIDTGMGRLGFPWETAAADLLRFAARPGLYLAGIGTHLASSGALDHSFASLQISRFRQVLADCKARGLTIPFVHAANSDAFCQPPDWHFDAVRPGILLYGYGPGSPTAPQTRPFLQWKTRLVQVKSVPAGFPVSYDSTYRAPQATRIGTIPVGYSDGYSRAWSNKACVLVNGRRCPVVGRVTMNLTMVDLGPDSPARTGEEVVLLGEQSGASIWADELAAFNNTISYEVLTSIRSPRIAVEDHA